MYFNAIANLYRNNYEIKQQDVFFCISNYEDSVETFERVYLYIYIIFFID